MSEPVVCPSCYSTTTFPATAKAGTEATCPKCGQRILLPDSSTVFAERIGRPPAKRPVFAAPVAKPVAPWWRRVMNDRRWQVGAGAASLLVFVAFAVCMVTGCGVQAPQPVANGDGQVKAVKDGDLHVSVLLVAVDKDKICTAYLSLDNQSKTKQVRGDDSVETLRFNVHDEHGNDLTWVNDAAHPLLNGRIIRPGKKALAVFIFNAPPDASKKLLIECSAFVGNSNYKFTLPISRRPVSYKTKNGDGVQVQALYAVADMQARFEDTDKE